MKMLTEYFELQQRIYEYFGYQEDWTVIPLRDNTDSYWSFSDEDEVVFSDGALTTDLVEKGHNYSYSVYRQRFLPKWVYETADYTMVVVDTHTDGNEFLAVFDNAKRVEWTEEFNEAAARFLGDVMSKADTKRAIAAIDDEFWEKKFWAKVDKKADHWFWRGGMQRLTQGYSYGVNSRRPSDRKPGVNRVIHAHRIAWELVRGKRLRPSLPLYNMCGEPSCVNPDHWSRSRSLPGVRKVSTRAQQPSEKRERNEAIVQYRKDNPNVTLHEIGQKFDGISRQAVEQILRRYGSASV